MIASGEKFFDDHSVANSVRRCAGLDDDVCLNRHWLQDREYLLNARASDAFFTALSSTCDNFAVLVCDWFSRCLH